ncbi:MAG TPA: nucleoside:proton symporter, partial [Epsilonproteobacteria bacterium]|nr:nucleoside:proton symporter [Campylobacterota bacterium]
MSILQGLLGLAFFIGVAWLLSEQRDRVQVRWIIAGLGIQWSLALLLLKVPLIQGLFVPLSDGVNALQAATAAGTHFVFGYLTGEATPFDILHPEHSFIFAFQVLPLVLVVSALSALLFHWRILPPIIHGFSWLLRRSFGIGGALGFSTAANVFVGMVEAPLLIRPYLAHLSRGELFAVMVAGMATVAGTVMVFYASILGEIIPNAMG